MTMTDDRNTLTMEQQARKLAESLATDDELVQLEERRERIEDLLRNYSPGGRFGLDEEIERLDEEIEQRRDEMRDHYGIDAQVRIFVHLYGGGPAGGVAFDVSRGQWGWEPDEAWTWHQDWFQPKGYWHLPESLCRELWDRYIGEMPELPS